MDLVYKTQWHGQVTGCNDLAAGLANFVFGDFDTVASFAAVCINSKSWGTDTSAEMFLMPKRFSAWLAVTVSPEFRAENNL
jgi:hypothetical protein